MNEVSVFQIKVTLQHVKPPIWRRLLVPADITLLKLHRVLQAAMGWTNSHLHQYRVGGMYYGTANRDFDFGGPLMLSEARARLGDVLPAEKSAMVYEYDFGDGWEHRVVLEKVLPPDPETALPVCLAGAGACPPEDCGGPPGYEELLRVLSDPADEEHEDMFDWVGGVFDSAAFDLTVVNKRLRPRKPAARRS